MKKLYLCLLAALCLSTVVKAQPTAGLVAYWTMDGNFVDYGPNFINGINFGATATTNNKAIANRAMNFNNPTGTVAQYATVSSALLNFSAAQNFSVDFSYYANAPFAHAYGFFDHNINYGGYGLFMMSGPTVYFYCRNGTVNTSTGAAKVGTWQHICAVKSGTTIKIYINGVLNVSGPAGGLTPVYSYAARFGAMFYNAYAPPQYNGLHGKLDEFRIYNRALTDLEILILSSTALPVKLSSFTGVNKNNNITLNWETQYEQNSSHYIVQRSIDGVNFTDVGRVKANGISNIPLFYTYNDDLPASVKLHKTVYYRLQTFDTDGGSSISHIVSLQLDKTAIQLLVYPSPAKNLLQVQTGSGLSGKALLTITDGIGRRLFNRDVDLQRGSNSIPVNVSHYGAGIYYVRLTTGDETFTKQFIKE